MESMVRRTVHKPHWIPRPQLCTGAGLPLSKRPQPAGWLPPFDPTMPGRITKPNTARLGKCGVLPRSADEDPNLAEFGGFMSGY